MNRYHTNIYVFYCQTIPRLKNNNCLRDRQGQQYKPIHKIKQIVQEMVNNAYLVEDNQADKEIKRDKRKISNLITYYNSKLT